MRTIRIACFVLLLLAPLTILRGQGFVNLDFEQSTIVSSMSFPGQNWNSGIANVPGWTLNSAYAYGVVSNYPGGVIMTYNSPTLDAPGITLVTANFPNWPAIDGKYSILFIGGDIPSWGWNCTFHWSNGADPKHSKIHPISGLRLRFTPSHVRRTYTYTEQDRHLS